MTAKIIPFNPPAHEPPMKFKCWFCVTIQTKGVTADNGAAICEHCIKKCKALLEKDNDTDK